MAYLKICVRRRRKDGFYQVYLRVTHKRQIGYLPTDKVVPSALVSRHGEVEDPYVITTLSKKIIEYIEKLNRIDIEDWSVSRVIDFLRLGGEVPITFSEWARKYIAKLAANTENEHRLSYAQSFSSSLLSLEKYNGGGMLAFNEVTPELINGWLASSKLKSTTAELYRIHVRKMFKLACEELNDEEHGEVIIKDPWDKVKFKVQKTPIKRAISPKECRSFFSAPIKLEAQVVARDICMLSFCLAGMNLSDLLTLRKRDYYDGIIHYSRNKTKGKRADKAYFEIRVPQILYPIMERYAAPEGDDLLFSFGKWGGLHETLVGVRTALKVICNRIGISRCVFYTFRHTWATFAQNYCGASIGDVAFALNHTMGENVTRGYIKLDFSPAWELNDKVIDFVFFSADDEEHDEARKAKEVWRITPKVKVHAAVYHKGRLLGEVSDVGYANEAEVVQHLKVFVGSNVPRGSMLQYKIELETGAMRVLTLPNE